jgi:hypothetical protein
LYFICYYYTMLPKPRNPKQTCPELPVTLQSLAPQKVPRTRPSSRRIRGLWCLFGQSHDLFWRSKIWELLSTTGETVPPNNKPTAQGIKELDLTIATTHPYTFSTCQTKTDPQLHGCARVFLVDTQAKAWVGTYNERDSPLPPQSSPCKSIL